YYTLEVMRNGDLGFVDVNKFNYINGKGSDIDFDPTTGEINWDTNNRDVGSYAFRITHHDGHNHSATDEFEVKVKNDPPRFTTKPDPDQCIRFPGSKFVYQADSTDESQHDWRGDDNVTYSLAKGPTGMKVDPMTGLVTWNAPPRSGDYEVELWIEDGNGGKDLQRFIITVEQNDPVPLTPDQLSKTTNEDSDSSQSRQGISQSESGEEGFAALLQKLRGGEEETENNSPGNLGIRPDLLGNEEFAFGVDTTFDDLLDFLAEHDMRQPIQEIAGSEPPITPLAGFHEAIAEGRRLHFSAEDALLWDALEIEQPSLDIPGTTDVTTPLENFNPAVENGKRLDFEYFPIEEAKSIDMDDLTVADILDI
ncbi:Ig domain-containing protein, partial [Thermodesulfobacteriota bacterium]